MGKGTGSLMSFDFYKMDRESTKKIPSQRTYMKKTKLPKSSRTNRVFCRNCNAQNTNSSKTCVQCNVTIREPKLRRPNK